MHDGMVCPVCEKGLLKAVQRNLEFEYKGEKEVITNHSILSCSLCHEAFTDPKKERALEHHLTDVRRTIDGLLTSKDIKRIRSKFGFTQIKFAEVLKVGKKSFARYESGQSAQSRTMDNLLRILDKHPHTIRDFIDEWEGFQCAQVIEFASIRHKRKRWKMPEFNCEINDGEITCHSNSN